MDSKAFSSVHFVILGNLRIEVAQSPIHVPMQKTASKIHLAVHEHSACRNAESIKLEKTFKIINHQSNHQPDLPSAVTRPRIS